MGLVWLRWRAELHAKWRSWLVLALLVGLGGGVALTAFAGARRTDAAMGRFVDYSLPDDGGFLFGSVFSPPVAPGAAANSLALFPAEQRVVDLPQVVAHFRAPYLFLTPDPTGRNNHVGGLNTISAADPDLHRRVDRPLVVAGHLPNPTRPFNVAINELAATKRHLHLGSRIRLYAYSVAQFQNGGLIGSPSIRPQAPAGPSFVVRVSAIVRFPQDVSAVAPLAAKQNVSYEGQQNLYLTPAFLPRLADGLGIPVQGIPDINLVSVRLRPGTPWKAFATAAQRAGGNQITVGQPDNVYGIRRAAASAQRGIHLEVVALLIFGALAGLVTLLLMSQAIARQAQLETDDNATLRSLGATRTQLTATTLLRAAVIGVTGAAIAFGTAVLASPLMPFGLARQAEIHPGRSLDAVVLIPGFLAIAALVVAGAAISSWRVSRRSAAPGSDDRAVPAASTRLADALARSSAPLTAVIGVRYGLQRGRGRSRVPVSTAMIGAITAVAALTAAVTFGTSLGHLVSSPHQQGWNWDALVGNPNDMTDRETQAATLLAHDRHVASYSAIAILAGAGQGNAYIQGVPLNTLLAIDPLKGAVYPPLLEGHAPHSTHEIVLGSHTLDQLHRRVGQTVRTATPTGPVALHIVGRMIAPSIGDLFTNSLGEGGWVSGALARKQTATAPPRPNGLPPAVFVLFAVRYAHGASPQAAFASLQREFGPTVLRHLPAEDVVNLQSVDRLPFVLAGLIVVLGAATVGNTLVSAVRRRKRDLAILKTIGFVRRQVAAVVAWQATSFCVVALAVGIPLGVAGGRWAWSLVSSGIGSTSPAVVPTTVLALMLPATLAVGTLLAMLPGWAAARVAPAVIMRNE